MTDLDLDRIYTRAATPATCLHCGGVGSHRDSEGESRCAPCAGTGTRPQDPEVLEMVITLRRYRTELEALRAALGARYDR
jgi:DnaJ-class molecular chaperone